MTVIPKTLKQVHSVMAHQSSSASVGSAGATTQHSEDSGTAAQHVLQQRHHHHRSATQEDLAPPVLVYHESARSIVFRDHLRRAAQAEERGQNTTTTTSDGGGSSDSIHHHRQPHISSERERQTSQDLSTDWNEMSHLFGGDNSNIADETTPQMMNATSWSVEIQGFQPNVVPLPHLQLGANDEFTPLLESSPDHTSDDWTASEQEVVDMLESQHAVVKTIKNTDWTAFLRRFQTPHPPRQTRYPDSHNDIAPTTTSSGGGTTFNSFVTSTSLLPPGGRKMRCYGNPNNYTTGVIFALPKFSTEPQESNALLETRTWAWPSGYSAKTEFNIGDRGELLNGRQEALVSLSTLRKYNMEYLTQSEYMIGGRKVQANLIKTVPYNEIFLRVGGLDRIVNGINVATGEATEQRSLEKGVGLPVALFVRTATFGHLISLLRTRARLSHVLGEKHIRGIPLLYISSDHGIRVLTDKLQHRLLKIASRHLNPFQNPMIAHKTTMETTEQSFLETKVEELIDLDDQIRQTLTPEECVRLAGGFGVSDESIAQILKDAMNQDKQNDSIRQTHEEKSHHLQDIVNEGLASAVRSGDYYTSRQLLILYSLVASEGHQLESAVVDEITDENGHNDKLLIRKKSLDSDVMLLKRQANGVVTTTNSQLPPPPPPPPLDTDRLRSATNSDGLLAVLGAAQVLKAMQDGSAKKRTEESFLAVEE